LFWKTLLLSVKVVGVFVRFFRAAGRARISRIRRNFGRSGPLLLKHIILMKLKTAPFSDVDLLPVCRYDDAVIRFDKHSVAAFVLCSTPFLSTSSSAAFLQALATRGGGSAVISSSFLW
jgi:hypothetical protein